MEENSKSQKTDSKNKNIGKSGVYQIRNKLNGKIYIGSSNNMERRWYAHKRDMINGRHENKHLRNYINKLRREMNIDSNKLNEIFHFGCLEYESDTDKRFALEQEYLNLLHDRGLMCYNHRKIANPQYNYLLNDPETKKMRMSIALKARCSNDEYRKKMSIIVKTRYKNDDYRKKMAAAAKIRCSDNEYRKKMSIIGKIRCSNDEYRKKMSIIAKARWSDNDQRVKHYNGIKNKWNDLIFREKIKILRNSPESKKKMSISTKKLWENKEYRDKRILLLNNPESRRKKSESLKRTINRPENKRRTTESKIKSGLIKPFLLINETGICFYIENYSEWSRENNLSERKIKQLMDGEKNEYNGYRLHLSKEAVFNENQKFFDISRSADLYSLKKRKHLCVLSKKTYNENIMRKLKNL